MFQDIIKRLREMTSYFITRDVNLRFTSAGPGGWGGGSHVIGQRRLGRGMAEAEACVHVDMRHCERVTGHVVIYE
jgi:hypothetical protein